VEFPDMYNDLKKSGGKGICLFFVFMITFVGLPAAHDSLIILEPSDSSSMLQDIKYIESIGG
jgi:hypothetical protein